MMGACGGGFVDQRNNRSWSDGAKGGHACLTSEFHTDSWLLSYRNNSSFSPGHDRRCE